MKVFNLFLVFSIFLLSSSVSVLFSQNSHGYWKELAIINEASLSTFVSVECADNKNCIAIGYDGADIYAYYTENAGKTWSLGEMPSNYYNNYNYIKELSYPNHKMAVFVADSGYTYISKDKGKKWKIIRIPILINHIDVEFYDENFGVIAAGKQIVITRDGGDTWEIIDRYKTSPDYTISWEVNIIDENTIYIYGSNSKSVYRMITSTDAGKTWTEGEIIPYRLISIHFFDKMNGIAAGTSKFVKEDLMHESIFKTSDGGQSWEIVVDRYNPSSSHGLRAINFSDSTNGVATGYLYNHWITSDRGETWKSVDDLKKYVKVGFNDVAYLDNQSYIGVTFPYSYIYGWYPDSISNVENDGLEFLEYSSLSLFPNPARDELTIKSEQPLLEYELTDVFGTLLNYEKELLMYGMQPELRVNTSKLSVGIYFLKIKTLDGIEYRKFIKE